MKPEDFRRLALSLPEAIESAHMRHPDFRVAGKIFASLGYPDEDFGMVALSSVDQERFVQEYPKAFTPAKGAWGRRGSTQVLLRVVGTAALREAVSLAYYNKAPSRLRKAV